MYQRSGRSLPGLAGTGALSKKGAAGAGTAAEGITEGRGMPGLEAAGSGRLPGPKRAWPEGNNCQRGAGEKEVLLWRTMGLQSTNIWMRRL